MPDASRVECLLQDQVRDVIGVLALGFSVQGLGFMAYSM